MHWDADTRIVHESSLVGVNHVVLLGQSPSLGGLERAVRERVQAAHGYAYYDSSGLRTFLTDFRRLLTGTT